MIQVQSKFCPLGAPVGEVDGGIVGKGQLDCSLGENQNVVNVVGSVVDTHCQVNVTGATVQACEWELKE